MAGQSGKEPIRRDEPHGRFKIVGNAPIRIFTTHVIDKGKPLYDTGKKKAEQVCAASAPATA